MPHIDIGFARRHRALVAVTALQLACAAVFVIDVLGELPELRSAPLHPLSELLAVVALMTGSGIGIAAIRRILRDNARMLSRARAASGAFLDLLEDSFARWGLTPSEREVALFAIKGLSVAEIAALRDTQAGTVKAQCAAVYRKAGVNSRAELLSHFIEDLLGGLVLDSQADVPQSRRDPAAASRSDVALQHTSP